MSLEARRSSTFGVIAAVVLATALDAVGELPGARSVEGSGRLELSALRAWAQQFRRTRRSSDIDGEAPPANAFRTVMMMAIATSLRPSGMAVRADKVTLRDLIEDDLPIATS
jgi:hypothetical protein